MVISFTRKPASWMVSGIKVTILILILRLASPLCFQNYIILLNKVKFNAWGYQSVSCDVETVSFGRSVPNIRLKGTP
jgi:hypothetical protein